jgi:hypothetical protein
LVLSVSGVVAWTDELELPQELPLRIGVCVVVLTPPELAALMPLPEAAALVLVEPLAAVAGALTAVPVLVVLRALMPVFRPSARAPLPMPLPRPPLILETELETAPLAPRLPAAPNEPTCANALVATHARLQAAMTMDFFMRDRSLFASGFEAGNQ